MSVSMGTKFRKSKEEQWFMRFKTKHPDGHNDDGIVIHTASSFVVLREIWDFDIDGVIVLPKRSICGFRDGKFESCTNTVLRHSKILRWLRTPSWLPRCATLREVLENLQRRAIWPGIETLRNDGSTAFYLGSIEEISAEDVVIRGYDATGKWEKPSRFPLSDIFRIEFDSRYCNAFNRYMRATAATT